MSKPLSPSEPAIAVAPLNDIPFARINLGAIENPTPLIARSPEFAETKRYFRDAPSAARSLLNESSQALLYTVIRNLQPDHVVEIGTYKGGTSETLCRALHANGHGTLHTLSPFDAELFAANSQWWPEELQRVVQYYPMTSMEFFIVSDTMKLAFDLVLVDGNHDYEFANFDIQSAARRLTPGGFIFIDNVSQAGPFLAATEFLAAHPDWIDCGVRPLNTAREHAFDRSPGQILRCCVRGSQPGHHARSQRQVWRPLSVEVGQERNAGRAWLGGQSAGGQPGQVRAGHGGRGR